MNVLASLRPASIPRCSLVLPVRHADNTAALSLLTTTQHTATLTQPPAAAILPHATIATTSTTTFSLSSTSYCLAS
ncbi:hypothetical protein E2C01_005323 [Portunus trituberculatus]|uniref:Uncharacterized protein n=1 Tax=Portunus trituberculatus TaxID=210409 RepID=A0A5B7CT85_PORTR|nr:hypothetical protein [Portunus trituberculatus]